MKKAGNFPAHGGPGPTGQPENTCIRGIMSLICCQVTTEQNFRIMIEKHRYRMPLADGLEAEIHVHEGHLAGFSYAEVEFNNIGEVALFEPPGWFGREVTEDVRFSYGILARDDGNLGALALRFPHAK